LLISDNAELTVKGEKEKRKLTPEEQTLFDANLKSIEQLEKNILVEEELRKIPAMKVKENLEEGRPFSLFAAIDNEINHRGMDAPTTAMVNEGRAEFAKAGGEVKAAGQIILPSESKIVTRTAIVAGGTTTGGYIVQTDKKAVLPPLTNYLVLTKAGATYLTGLVGSVSIPTYSGTTVAWKEETVSAADGAGTWGKVDLAPKRLTAYLDVSKQFLAQDSVGAEKMLYENLAKAISSKLESTILGTGEGSSVSTPQGLFWGVYTAGATTLSWSSIVALETTIDAANNIADNMAYITSATGRGAAKTTLVTSTYGDRMIMALDGTINGYPVYVSNGVAKTTDFSTTTGFGFIFGNWADLIIGQWGGYDLTIDPYSQAVYANVRIVVNCYFDAQAARTTSSFAPKHMV
jgi:HK97 family phage major capsid protein